MTTEAPPGQLQGGAELVPTGNDVPGSGNLGPGHTAWTQPGHWTHQPSDSFGLPQHNIMKASGNLEHGSSPSLYPHYTQYPVM